MATTEKDILMNNKKNGNTDILYPITKGSNVLCDDEEKVQEKFDSLRTKAFSIATSAWSLNSTSGLYEATISDTSVNSYDDASVNVDASTYAIAVEAKVKAYVTEIQGTGIRLYAEDIPSGTISGKYNVNRGVSNG